MSKLIFRYDTAPHWEESKTSPYHKHLEDNNVTDSQIMYLENILDETISLYL